MNNEDHNDIRVFVLSDGTEIVTHVLCETETYYEIEMPMKILSKYVAEDDGTGEGVNVDTINMMVPWISSTINNVIKLKQTCVLAQTDPSEFCMEEWFYQVAQFLEPPEQDEPKTVSPAKAPTGTSSGKPNNNILTFPKR